MEKKKKRKHTNKKIYIYSFFILMIAVVISSAIYQNQFPHEKLPAEDYFEIRDAIIVDADLEKSTDQVLFITQIRFNLTAVGGDAHSILIMVTGMTPEEDWPCFSELNKNEGEVILLPRMTLPYRSLRTSEGYFPFPIRIDSTEASGTITVLLEN
jgi:hypothetical protein